MKTTSAHECIEVYANSQRKESRKVASTVDGKCVLPSILPTTQVDPADPEPHRPEPVACPTGNPFSFKYYIQPFATSISRRLRYSHARKCVRSVGEKTSRFATSCMDVSARRRRRNHSASRYVGSASPCHCGGLTCQPAPPNPEQYAERFKQAVAKTPSTAVKPLIAMATSAGARKGILLQQQIRPWQ